MLEFLPERPRPHEELLTKQDPVLQLPYTYGYTASDLSSKQIVQAGVSRALDSIFHSGLDPWVLRKRGSTYDPDLLKGQNWLKSLQIIQTGTDNSSTFKPLAGQVDESYSLVIAENATAKLTAVSSIGILYGLESFIQLFYKHSKAPFWYTPYVPVSIQDAPKVPASRRPAGCGEELV